MALQGAACCPSRRATLQEGERAAGKRAAAQRRAGAHSPGTAARWRSPSSKLIRLTSGELSRPAMPPPPEPFLPFPFFRLAAAAAAAPPLPWSASVLLRAWRYCWSHSSAAAPAADALIRMFRGRASRKKKPMSSW